MAVSTLPAAIDFQANPAADPTRMNVATTHIDQRLRALEAQRAGLNDEIASLQAIGLSRVNDALQPMFAVEQARIASGVLIAASETSAEIAIGASLQFLLDAAQWLSFSPSSFVSLTRTSTLTDSAVLRTTSYDPSRGLYVGVVVSMQGDPGPFDDWELSSGAGAVMAVLGCLAQVEADTAATHADRLQTDLDATATASDRTATHTDRQAADTSAANAHASEQNAAGSASAAEASAASISGGPVTSVNGKKGIVNLAPSDIGAASASDLAAAIGGAPTILDTLKELADAIADDPNFAATISAALNNRVRADAPQGFGAVRQATARDNIGAVPLGLAIALGRF